MGLRHPVSERPFSEHTYIYICTIIYNNQLSERLSERQLATLSFKKRSESESFEVFESPVQTVFLSFLLSDDGDSHLLP